jgi:thiamine biosynthesis lipoprotein
MKFRLLAAALGLLALILSGCTKTAPTAQEAYVFGTRVELLAWGTPEAQAHAALGEVLREFDRLHRAYHAWQPSELTALNEAIAAGKPHEVSAELADLIRTAQALAAQGDYLFDPGIGRLVALWGFHGDEFKPALPDTAELAKLVATKPSIAKLSIDGACLPQGSPKAGETTGMEPRSGEHPSPPPGRGVGGGCRITSADFSVALDFGGYLKGVALDRAAAILKSRGIDNALINIGGNVLAMGSKGGKPWRVGIQHPRAAQAGGAPLATLELRDGEAIGTSGDYQRYFELGGKRYCHLLDPRTGSPTTVTQSLTVLVPPGADAGMRSDVLSKPLFIAGDDWPRLAAKLGATQVLRVDAAGKVFVTAALKSRLAFEPADLSVTVMP